MKHKLLIAAIQLVAFGSVSAQNVNGLLFDATNSATRDASAAFEINANTNTPGSPLYGGLLLPRVALTGTTDATTIAGTEATSLLVYNTATVSDVTPGFYYWNGSSWLRIISGNGSFPTGSGTPNYLARWITANTLGIGATYDNGTSVGIGTTTPGQALEIYRDNADVGMRLHDPGDYHYALGIDRSDAGKFKINYGAGIGDADHFTMQSNGNVGIGNAAPGHQLSVGVATSDGQPVTIRGYSNSPSSWKGGGAFGYATATVIMGQLNGVAQIGGHNATLTGWADLALNSAGGNVGIGSTAPTGKLDVNGGASVLSNAYLDINRDSYARSGISWYSQSYPSWSTYMAQATQTSVGPHGDLTAPTGTFVNSWALREYIENAGGYGWTFESAANTTTPTIKFEIRASDGLFHSYGNGIVDGNIGIGSNSPIERLDIAGNARATGVMYWGNAGTRTETRDDAGLMGGRSGFYETSVPAPAANWYTGASSWQHLLETRHSNTGNNYAMQIAGSFFDQDFWVRKTNNSATTAWSKMLTTSNISSSAILNQYTSAQTASFWINGNAQVGSSFTNLNGRLLTSNQSGWQADGVTPQMVISANSASTNRAALIGLDLHNDNTTNNVYAPFITFSRRSNGTAYNSAFAAIGAQVTGQGTDANWCAGDLIFATENGTVNGMGERMRIDKSGRVYILQNQGGDPNFAGLDDPTSANGRAQLVLSSSYSDLVIASSEGNDNHGSTLTFATYNPGNTADYRKFVINQGNWGARRGFLDFGFSDASGRSNPHANINNGDNVLSLDGFNKRVGVGTMSPVSTFNVVGKSTMSRDNATECCGNDATLALAESTSGTGRRAGISFHNGGVAEGTLELAGSGTRRIRLYDNQSIGMGLEMTGDFINQNVEWNQATASNYTVGANSGQHVINNSTVTLSKSSGNATNNGYSVVLLVANVTASGNDITWANGVGGYQTVQSLGHGVAGYRVYLQRSTDNANWTTLIAGSAIVGMQVGDYYMQYSGITSMVGISGDAFKFSNNVSLNYIDNVGAGTYYYRLLFETTGYNKSGGSYLISDRALSVVEIKR